MGESLEECLPNRNYMKPALILLLCLTFSLFLAAFIAGYEPDSN
jgi:hypothetical protein